MLIGVHHLILTIKKKFFSVLGEGPTDVINVSTGAAEKIVLTLVKQIQTFA